MSNNRFNQGRKVASARFARGIQNEVEKSRFRVPFTHWTAFNAGDIVPVKCIEMVPNETYDFDLTAIIRQTTARTPTMGQLQARIYAFFVPNRVVNQSWVNVQGENSSGSWTAPEVQLAPLWQRQGSPTVSDEVQIPVGSVADFYGLPTQAPLSGSLLSQMHDLKFRGYLAIYNEYFRDQNYQPPIPFSKLNVYQGFLARENSLVSFGNQSPTASLSVTSTVPSDGSYPLGAIKKAVYGEGYGENGYPNDNNAGAYGAMSVPSRYLAWSALSKPLRANKMHDYFTSVLPDSQKGKSVSASVRYLNKVALVEPSAAALALGSDPATPALYSVFGTDAPSLKNIYLNNQNAAAEPVVDFASVARQATYPVNLGVSTSGLSATVGIPELRMSAAIQQYYEQLARSGSRYRSIVDSIFGLDVDNPFKDIPHLINYYDIDLDLYQTAQTSATGETPQGNLAAFGYTNERRHLLHYTALEHGYLHILCVVRQKNVYSSAVSRDWFRVGQLDYYQPILSNISEQPVYTREINPFGSVSQVFGYQEAWYEYRVIPDSVSGYMRKGISGSLGDYWTYADEFDSSIKIATGEWLKSNAREVVDNTIAVSSESAPQFKAQFIFDGTCDFPGPVYSVPGMDVI